MKNSRLVDHVPGHRYPDQFGDWLGYRVEKCDRKKHEAVITLRIRNEHLSPAGRVHGGVVSACFDAALGVAVFSTLVKTDRTATVELKVNYFRPVVLGDRLRITTRVVFRGNRLAVAHGFLHLNGEKAPAGMATGTFNIVSGATVDKPKSLKSK